MGFRTVELPAESMTVIVASYTPGATHAPLSARPFQFRMTWPAPWEAVVIVRRIEPEPRFLRSPFTVTVRDWKVATVMRNSSPAAEAGLKTGQEIVRFEMTGAVP